MQILDRQSKVRFAIKMFLFVQLYCFVASALDVLYRVSRCTNSPLAYFMHLLTMNSTDMGVYKLATGDNIRNCG